MIAFVALFCVFAAVANAQMSVIFFPPSVNYVNSDFNQTVPGGAPANGHFDFIKGNNMHLIASSMGFTVEEWVVESAGSVTAYLLMQGQCHKQEMPMPDLGCKGWTQNPTSGLWIQECNPEGGAITITVKVENGQPAYLDESMHINGQQMSSRITFVTTSAQPPSAGTLVPPASCQTTVIPRESHVQRLLTVRH